MTLKELYYEARKNTKPMTPGRAFINEVAQVTKKSDLAVRRWLSNESPSVPDRLTQEVLAKHFNTTPEELFPRQ
ncbi:MAG: hypothetical protein J1E16_04400 [Muribaculaceae bacterium]|nr:hypothetical protein [Muribaculaceae bacterium]